MFFKSPEAVRRIPETAMFEGGNASGDGDSDDGGGTSIGSSSM